MNDVPVVRPRLNLLSSGQRERVHEYSLRILSNAGVRVDSEKARRVFLKSGEVVAGEDNKLFLGRELVEWAISAVPSTVDIYNRTGERVFRLGEDRPRFGVGVTNLYYQDPLTDRITPFNRKNMETSVRLGHALANFDVVSTIGILHDLSPKVADLVATLEMIANTTKPLVLLISDERLFSPALDLLEHLHGNLAERPFVIPYFNSVTPLIINEGTGDKLLEAVQRGLPFIFSNYGMAGMSTPITPAGTLALLNAELLSGLALSQLARPGAPIILGSLPAIFDMKSMLDFYDARTMLLNLACAEMMAFYKIPHAGTSGSGLGWGSDLPGSGLLWMNHLTSCMGKIGLAPFVGGNLGSKVFSPSLVVYANEVIGESLRFARGFSLDEESFALEEIVAEGPGGHFLMAPTTLKLFREVHYQDPVFPRLTLEQWQDRGSPRADDLIRTYTRDLLERLEPPEDHDVLVDKGERFLAARHSLE